MSNLMSGSCHLDRASNVEMDYVRDGEIQGSSLGFFKAHCPCTLPGLT